ncbi:MAG: hypothetical protein WC845_01705 [Candidatus Staskawiczbacteria bacterium]|jgi:hypothetical protein
MSTVKEIKAKAITIKPSIRPGCFILDPPVALRCTTDLGDITKGEIVHAVSIDECGSYPDAVHLKEKAYWWYASYFEIQ